MIKTMVVKDGNSEIRSVRTSFRLSRPNSAKANQSTIATAAVMFAALMRPTYCVGECPQWVGNRHWPEDRFGGKTDVAGLPSCWLMGCSGLHGAGGRKGLLTAGRCSHE